MFEIYNLDVHDISCYMLHNLIYKNNINNINIINNPDGVITNIDNNKHGIIIDNNKLTNHSECYCKFKKKYNNDNNNNNNNNNDTLFWCFYKIYNDNDLIIDDKKFTIEKTFKLDFIDKLRLSKTILKKNKISLISCENEFANDKKITLDGFKALCLLYKKNVIVIRENNTYYKYFYENYEDINNYNNISIISCDKFNKYSLLNDISQDKIINIFSNYHHIEDHKKILKSITYYKSEDIVNMAKKLDIVLYKDINKKKTKKDLYEEILNKII